MAQVHNGALAELGDGRNVFPGLRVDVRPLQKGMDIACGKQAMQHRFSKAPGAKQHDAHTAEGGGCPGPAEAPVSWGSPFFSIRR